MTAKTTKQKKNISSIQSNRDYHNIHFQLPNYLIQSKQRPLLPKSSLPIAACITEPPSPHPALH